LLAGRPEIAKIVSHGVQAALDTFMDRKRLSSGQSVVWPELNWPEQEKHLGPYPWPAGVEANRQELELLIGYCVEQGILSRRISPEELFQAKG
jgi:hypothetical protein